jgi:hypothetical protein
VSDLPAVRDLVRPTLPTIESVAGTRERLLRLTSRRLIQFLDARRSALRALDPPMKPDGTRDAVDVAAAVEALRSTGGGL